MNFTFTAVSEPECKTFLRIKKDDAYYTIDEFIAKYHSDSREVLNDCTVCYRGTEKIYKKMNDDYTAFSKCLESYAFQEPLFVIDKSVRAAIYFAKKAKDCLQTARFFTMKSVVLLESDSNLQWSQGYVPQYLFRCIYFGTASTWYSNSFDHILQIAYWGLRLYTAVKDRDGNAYDDSWDVKKTMGLCTYEFVVKELKNRGLKDIRKYLTSCFGEIEEVRTWANYIKHKGGIDYRYVEPENPFGIFITPIKEGKIITTQPEIGELPDERFALNDFKSPVEVDIDEKLSTLKAAHIAICQCLGKIVTAADFNGKAIHFKNKEENSHE